MSTLKGNRAVFPIDEPRRFKEAGANDLIGLLPVPGYNPICIEKWRLEVIFYALVRGEFMHIAGPTGSGKTSVLLALACVPRNFELLCRYYGYKVAPLFLHPVEMIVFDTPGELIQRRGLKNGTTFDEESSLITSLREAAAGTGAGYQAIWLRELGRVHSATIQGGLLDLMTHGDIMLPDGNTISGKDVGWVADSNYSCEEDAVHVLAVFDDALKRRFTINLGLDYLSLEQEVQILHYLRESGDVPAVSDDLLIGVVQLGHAVRDSRLEGNLRSVTPPTIYGYMAFLRLIHCMPHLSLIQVAQATFLGNASNEDLETIPTVFSDVFGVQSEFEDDSAIGRNMV
jgi:energy-coupling factor transporter ATP-binding protein EcfA2